MVSILHVFFKKRKKGQQGAMLHVFFKKKERPSGGAHT
jgi:hypothetical protein